MKTIDIKQMMKELNEGEEIILDKDISSANNSPVGSQDPKDAILSGQSTAAQGDEKTPPSEVTNLEKPKEGYPTDNTVVGIAKGPQDAPTKGTPGVTTEPKAEEQPHEVLEKVTVNGKVYKLIKEDYKELDAIADFLEKGETKVVQPGSSAWKEIDSYDDDEGVRDYFKKQKVTLKRNSNGSYTLLKEGVEEPMPADVVGEIKNDATPADPAKVNEPGVTDSVPVEVSGDKKETIPIKEDGIDAPKFVIVDGEPRAVLQDMGEKFQVLYDALTGETREVAKEAISGLYDNVMSEVIYNESKIKQESNTMKSKRQVYVVKETVRIKQEGKDIFLDPNDRFVIIHEEEAKPEDKKEDETPKEDKMEKKEESIIINGKKYVKI